MLKGRPVSFVMSLRRGNANPLRFVQVSVYVSPSPVTNHQVRVPKTVRFVEISMQGHERNQRHAIQL
jgi:hypothetical protein